MVTQTAAQVLHLHVGESFEVTVGGPNSGPGPGKAVRVAVAGIGLLNHEVVQDQIEQFPTYVVATPALTRMAFAASQLGYFGVQLDGSPGAVASVERQWNASERFFTDFRVAAQTTQEADQSIRPEALALGAFGCIAGLTTLLIAFEEIARQRRNRDDELRIMRSLGASRAMTVTDGLFGTTGAIVLGGLVAAVLGVLFSPLSPIGPIRSVYPDGGFAADWTVLGVGTLTLVGILLAAAVLGAALRAPHRHATRSERVGRSGLADAVFRWGLPRARRWALASPSTPDAAVTGERAVGSLSVR